MNLSLTGLYFREAEPKMAAPFTGERHEPYVPSHRRDSPL